MAEHHITVNISDRPYRLIIKTEEEEALIRDSAKHLEELIKEYRSSYHYKDQQDLLAMVALQLAEDSISISKNVDYRDTALTEKLQEMDDFLNSNT
ncbi:MAG: cell division protein ZapA [Bacteroidetes bacterium 4572_77]|nr:MAG: cell division protein ZapA [Bacteroidetes bacterium 4572_77]